MLLNIPIANLLLRWEKLRAQGQNITPHELCRECPELLEELVNKLSSLQTTIHSIYGTPKEFPGTAEPGTTQSAFSGVPAIGDYQILGELGHGGMGIVFRAFDRKREEMVALKTLQRLDAAALYRLKQEFRTLAEVTHPNLVGLYELISSGHQCSIAMELIEGEHFLAYVRSGQSERQGASPRSSQEELGIEEAANYAEDGLGRPSYSTAYALSPHQYDRLRATLRQLARGISVLHAHGKLHRDIKPSNVMVTREGRVVLLDFGLAADLDFDGLHQSTEQHVTGTIAYMAPEQAASRAQSPATDWYSVGVMLYEALTGQLPFTGSPIQVLIDKQQREPLAPAELAPGLPDDLNQLCVDLLRQSPESRPTGDEVLQRLGKSPSVSDAPVGRHSVTTHKAAFVGRETQLAELNAAFQAMQSGRTSVVRLSGRSGAGKSLLAQHFLDGVQQRGEAVVLSGKCYERESVPYKALDSLIDALSRYLRRLPTHEAQALLPREVLLLSRVFPVLQRVVAVAEAPVRSAEIVDPHELRRRAFEALRELLGRLSDRKPLVLFIDDLQWGDLDGATQLVELLRPPGAPVLLLLACYRSEDAETSPCLSLLHRALEKANSALDQHRLSVDPLGDEEARELALTLLGRRDAASQAQAATIARESGGNPFFVHELVQCASANLDVAESPTGSMLVLDEILWSRIQALPDEPRRLLEVIAVSGQPLRLSEAREAANMSGDEHGTLAALRSGHLIRSSGSAELEEVETYHDRIRETILSHLPVEVVKDFHHRIATVLEASAPTSNLSGAEMLGAPASSPAPSPGTQDSRSLKDKSSKRIFDLAYHFDAAGKSDQALPYALAVADQARAQYALEIAEQLYRIAERGAEKADHATRYRVASSLGDVLMLAGRYPDAAVRFKAALALTTNTFTQAEIEGKLGELAFKQGDNRATCEALERSLRTLGRRVPSHTAVFGVCLIWEVLVQAMHMLFPNRFLARRALTGADEKLLAIRLYTRLAYGYFFDRGKVPCLWSHLRAINLAERYPPTLELGHAWATHAPVMSLLPWLSRGEAFAKRSLEIRKTLGDVCGQGQSLHYLGVVLFTGARFDECISACREAVTLLERTGDYWERNMAWYSAANALYRKGDLSIAITEAQKLYEAASEVGDDKVSGFILDVWSRASGGQLSADISRREMQKQRHDVQATAQVLLAEAVRLIGRGELAEAVTILTEARKVCREVGMMNAWVSPVLPWLATTHRLQWDRSDDSDPHRRRQILLRARKVARQALSVARNFQTDLPHALRECGLIAARLGQVQKAGDYFDESLAVAERQGARFEHAQTLLARGRLGEQHGRPEARQEITTACNALRELNAEFALEDSTNS